MTFIKLRRGPNTSSHLTNQTTKVNHQRRLTTLGNTFPIIDTAMVEHATKHNDLIGDIFLLKDNKLCRTEGSIYLKKLYSEKLLMENSTTKSGHYSCSYSIYVGIYFLILCHLRFIYVLMILDKYQAGSILLRCSLIYIGRLILFFICLCVPVLKDFPSLTYKNVK